jgi:hypothetical protein
VPGLKLRVQADSAIGPERLQIEAVRPLDAVAADEQSISHIAQDDYLIGERFGYNPMNQLESALYGAEQVWDIPLNPARSVTYTLNALNRHSMDNNGVVTTYTPNNLNQYVAVNGQVSEYVQSLHHRRLALRL